MPNYYYSKKMNEEDQNRRNRTRARMGLAGGGASAAGAEVLAEQNEGTDAIASQSRAGMKVVHGEDDDGTMLGPEAARAIRMGVGSIGSIGAGGAGRGGVQFKIQSQVAAEASGVAALADVVPGKTADPVGAELLFGDGKYQMARPGARRGR